MLNPLKKLFRQISERGVKGTVIQLYTIGDLKFGVLRGVDSFNNKYYEDVSLPYGQHRWVEYSNIHNPDPTMIQPEWHGWMHHVFDETPDEAAKKAFDTLPTAVDSHAIFNSHVAPITRNATEQVDLTQYRQRGYKVGSLMTGPEDPDQYYLQDGHPLSPKRFKDKKTVEK